MSGGIFQDVIGSTLVQIARMGIAETCYHTVWEEIFGRGLHTVYQDRTLLEHINSRLFIEHIGKIAEGAKHRGAITRRFVPGFCLLIETKVDEFVQAPLADTVLIHHIIQIILLALAVGISLVILQNKSYFHDEIGLKQVPVVMRHTIGNDILRPLLETHFDDRLVFLDEISDEWIHLGEFIDDIFVDNLEGSHSHQCLLMTVVQVDRHIAIGDAFHIDIKHLSRHLAVAHIASCSIDAGSISGDAHNLSVHAGDVTTRLGWRSLLHLA